MKMDVLKCKTVEGVLKELTVYAIVYNLVRMVMVEAARQQGVDVERNQFRRCVALGWPRRDRVTHCRNWWSIPSVPAATSPA